MPGYFPIAISLSGRSCLVVGGGKVALRKVRALLEYGGAVTVVAPDVCEELVALADAGRITLHMREYAPAEAACYGLVVAAVDDPAVNRTVFADCRAAGVLINAVDDPEHCDFILSGTVRRGPLTVSIGTQGTAPFFARWVREQLDGMLPSHWEDVAALAESFRKRVLADANLDQAAKDALFARFLQEDWRNVIENGGMPAAKAAMESLLAGEDGA
jgi:siroheme synthase-like protein